MENHEDLDMKEEVNEIVCCICGDVGFQHTLFLCKKCDYRMQHTYCSRFYPEINTDNLRCEWCIHEEQRLENKTNKSIDLLIQIEESIPESSIQEKTSPDTDFSEEVANIRERSSTRRSTRYLERNKALDRWRNLARSKLGSRRYKLLTDVPC